MKQSTKSFLTAMWSKPGGRFLDLSVNCDDKLVSRLYSKT